jgi:hypothetical protein
MCPLRRTRNRGGGRPSNAPGRPDGNAPQSDVRNALPGADDTITPDEDEGYSRFGDENAARPFFSALTRGIEGIKQPKASAQQWLVILKGLQARVSSPRRSPGRGSRTG